MEGSWVKDVSAGGNWKSPSWRTNQQYKLSLTAATNIHIVLHQRPLPGQVIPQPDPSLRSYQYPLGRSCRLALSTLTVRG